LAKIIFTAVNAIQVYHDIDLNHILLRT
jgi:hypothetical protein